MAIILALAIAGIVTLALQTSVEPAEKKFVWGALLMRLFGTAGLLAVHETRGSDMDGYGPHGVMIAELVRANPGRWLPEVINAILHRDTALPVVAGSTGAMDALASLAFLLVGNSLVAACLAVSTLVLVGQVLLYRVCRSFVARDERHLVAGGCFAVPSMALWTGGLVKEAFAVAGMCIAIHAAHGVLTRRRIHLLLPGAVGVLLIAAVKPYVLFPLVLAATVSVFAVGKGRIRRPFLVLGAALALAAIVALGDLFPEYSVDHLGHSISSHRMNSEQAGGGSDIDFDEAGNVQMRDRTLAGQLKFLPLGLVNALLRPFLFEVRNAQQLGAALEATLLMLILFGLLRRVRLKELFAKIASSPLLLGSGVFVLAFAAAVGLSSTNLGTISRYRVPMMPFFAMSMLILRHRFRPAAQERPPLRVRAPARARPASARPRPPAARPVGRRA